MASALSAQVVASLEKLLHDYGYSNALLTRLCAAVETRKIGDGEKQCAPARGLEEVASCALSLAFLQRFYSEVVLLLPGGKDVTTKALVESIIKPFTCERGLCHFGALASKAVGVPTGFASHAFGGCSDWPKCTHGCACCAYGFAPAACSCPLLEGAGRFGLVVAALTEHYANAVAEEVFVWRATASPALHRMQLTRAACRLDIFAINQHDPGAELHNGGALARTIELAAETLVVLDPNTPAFPLQRLWCLYEMGSCPAAKLWLLTPGMSESRLIEVFRSIRAENAACYDSNARDMILKHIEERNKTLSDFEILLKLRLLLKPTSYEQDCQALLAYSQDEQWRFGELRAFATNKSTTSTAAVRASRLACIEGDAGEGKSTLSAAVFLTNDSPFVHAAHFFKASDHRRQDVSLILRSLAYQLSLAFPTFAQCILELEEEEILSLSNPLDAWELLLKKPLSAMESSARIVLLFDALDEANIQDNGEPGTSITPALSLLLELGRLHETDGYNGAALSLIATSRPQRLIVSALRGRWKENYSVFEPASLRCADTGHTKLLSLLRSKTGSASCDVESAYAHLFELSPPDTSTSALLSVLLSARQPPSIALLETLECRSACTSLPGWKLLFYERDHCIHMLHRSLAEWLRTQASSEGRFAVDEVAGHKRWSTFLMDKQLNPWLFPAAGCSSAPPPPKGSYAYKHVMAHLDACGESAVSQGLLLRLPWLQRLLAERGIHVVIRELAERSLGSDALSMLRKVLLLASPALRGADAAACLCTQLLSRLRDGNAVLLRSLLDEARNWKDTKAAWMKPVNSSLRGPGAMELVMGGHTGGVRSVAVLPDGRVVSGSSDRSIRLWNVFTGECEKTLVGHAEPVSSVAVLPDSLRIVSGSDDFSVKLWSVSTGECEMTLLGHSGCVNSLSFLPDGRILSASSDKTIKIWNASAGHCEATLAGHTDGVNSIVGHPDGYAVSGSKDNSVRLWNVSTAECDQTLVGHTASVCSVAILPDRTHIVSGSTDTFRLWNASTGECEKTLKAYTDWMSCIVVLPDGRVMCGSRDSTLRLWNFSTDQCEQTLEGHAGAVRSLALLPDGRAVSASEDATVRLWNAFTTEREKTSVGHVDFVLSLAVLPDGGVVSGSYDNMVRLWNSSTGKCEKTLEGHTGSVFSLAVFPDGMRFVSGSRDNTVRLWNVATAECEKTLVANMGWVKSVAVLPDGRVVSGSSDRSVRLWNAFTGECEKTLMGHDESVSSLAVLPDSLRIVSGSDDFTLRLWNVMTGECEKTLIGHNDWVNSLSLLPDGRILSGSYDSTVKIWNVFTGECEMTLEGHSAVFSVTFLPDGRAASGSEDKSVRIWNVFTGECEMTLEGHSASVSSLSFLPGGRAVSGSGDNTIRIWNCSTGECEKTLEGRTDCVFSVAMMPDGRLVSASDDYAVRLWNFGTGECEKTLLGHAGFVRSLAVLPDGGVVSGSDDSTVKIWNVSLEQCMKTLEGHSGSVLSLAVFPDEMRVVSGSRDNTVRLWNVATAECEKTLVANMGWVKSVAVLPDGRVVSGSSDRSVRLWNAFTGECEKTLVGHAEPVSSVAVLPDSLCIVSSDDFEVRLWNASTGECLHVFQRSSALTSEIETALAGGVSSLSRSGNLSYSDACASLYTDFGVSHAVCLDEGTRICVITHAGSFHFFTRV